MIVPCRDSTNSVRVLGSVSAMVSLAVGCLAGCEPYDGQYLLQTETWSTQCTVGSGPYPVPANQYAIDVLLDSDDLWLDDHHCIRDGSHYTCDDEPLISILGGGYEATVSVRRAWTGGFADRETMSGEVVWTADCAGEDCTQITADGIELCGATWTYSAVAVSWE